MGLEPHTNDAAISSRWRCYYWRYSGSPARSTLSHRMTAEATRPEPLWVHSRQASLNLAFSFSFSISSISFPREARPLFERSTPLILDMPLPVSPHRGSHALRVWSCCMYSPESLAFDWLSFISVRLRYGLRLVLVWRHFFSLDMGCGKQYS